MSKPPAAAGGFHAIGYTLTKARESGGILRMYRSLKSKNACKTCALGMGGQLGGMVNEIGHFPEFCKKSVQAMASDQQPAIPAHLIAAASFSYLEGLTPRQLETMGRITTPLVAERGSDRYKPVSWDEAFNRLSGQLRATPPDESFFYFSGRSSNEAGFLLQVFARLFGTNNVNNCSFYCHQASAVGLADIVGAGTGSVQLTDLEQTDLMFIIGGNPASNHPRLMSTLMSLKRRGGKVIVINPLRETGLMRFRIPSDPRSLLFGTEIADILVQPHIGGDIPLLLAVAKGITARAAEDRGFLNDHTNGYAEFSAQLDTLDNADLVRQSGVEQSVIDQLVSLYATSKATVFAWAMGITHHLHGVDNVRVIADLALLRGMCGKAGAGLMPLRGHSNIQGLGTMGVSPKLREAIFTGLEKQLSVTLPTSTGLDTMQSMERATAGGIRTAWCLGGNLFGSNPDATYATASLGAIDQIVYLNTTLNTGHVHGRGKETWILPVLARDEEAQSTTQESMFSFVRLSDGGTPRHHGPLSEVQVIAGVAGRVLPQGPLPWKELEDHGKIRKLIAAVVPGMAALSDIGETKKEFHISGRSFPTPNFRTSDGKANLITVAVPAQPSLAANQLRMMTIRSEGQFNTVVYEDHDRYRGTERRDILLMNKTDRERLGLKIDQLVTVSSSAGSMPNIRVRDFAIRAGNSAMYYPEANVLVPRAVDPESGTPSFKLVIITLRPT